MTTVADILKTKAERPVHTIGPAASVFEAVQAIAQQNIGALLVVDDGHEMKNGRSNFRTRQRRACLVPMVMEYQDAG